MLPGIPRATFGAIIGLFVGMAVVTLLRVLIGIEPYWNTGLSMTLGVFVATAGVIWGMGGFNPSMSQHADDSQPPLTPDDIIERDGPLSVLGGTAWYTGFMSLIGLIVFIGLAYVPGLGLTVTNDANSSVKSVGTVPITLFGTEIMVSQVVLLLGVILFTILSLALAGGIIAWIFMGLSRGVANANAVEKTGTGLPRGLERSLANQAGRLAERIAPPEDNETTSVVAK